MTRVILAADVGGTKTNLALAKPAKSRLAFLAEATVRNQQYPSLESILKEFLTEHGAEPTHACLGVAGPIVDGCCAATNMPWIIDTKRVAAAVKLKVVTLINDLTATAYGIEILPPKAFAVLNKGEAKPKSAIAVIAAGTGLGEAALIWDGKRYRAVPSEGGHADFAPRNELEIDLLRELTKRFGHVSYERLVSGPGKVAIYQFLKETGRWSEPEEIAKALEVEDPSPLISEYGLSGRSTLCAKALELFVSIYGAEAGNLVLKFLARSGVYIGGGIAPTILPKLTDGTFMSAFTDKGRFTELLSKVPVRVILEEKTALYGAASYAALAGNHAV